jgi:hypothetical protein
LAAGAAACAACGAPIGEAPPGARIVGVEPARAPGRWPRWRRVALLSAIGWLVLAVVAVVAARHGMIASLAVVALTAPLAARSVDDALARGDGPCPRCRRIRVRPRGGRPATTDLAIGDWRSLVACRECARCWTVDIGGRFGTAEEWTPWSGSVVEWVAVHDLDALARRTGQPPSADR